MKQRRLLEPVLSNSTCSFLFSCRKFFDIIVNKPNAFLYVTKFLFRPGKCIFNYLYAIFFKLHSKIYKVWFGQGLFWLVLLSDLVWTDYQLHDVIPESIVFTAKLSRNKFVLSIISEFSQTKC